MASKNAKLYDVLETSLLERNRRHLEQLKVVLDSRRDLNMELGYHEVTLEKARRLGTGIVAPLSQTLRKQELPLPLIIQKPVEEEKRTYLPIVDNKGMSKSRTVGLTHRFAGKTTQDKRDFGRIFPMYGLANEKLVMQTTKKLESVPVEEAVMEACYKSRLFHKQKYEVKDYIETLLRARVNPNKRE